MLTQIAHNRSLKPFVHRIKNSNFHDHITITITIYIKCIQISTNAPSIGSVILVIVPQICSLEQNYKITTFFYTNHFWWYINPSHSKSERRWQVRILKTFCHNFFFIFSMKKWIQISTRKLLFGQVVFEIALQICRKMYKICHFCIVAGM